ncbi:MAG: N-acetyltransferase [Bacteroidaceae bacterium]|nr:N-acetyltransferase [Bacteroidaceae bacterium]
MAIVIKRATSNSEIKEFITFPNRLYQRCKYYVPKLYFDQFNSLSPNSNPAKDFCEYSLFLAYKDGTLVGRVAAIINNKANEQWNHKEVRFGWLDFIDDRDVSKALIDEVEAFGREKGMDKIVGPLGFTDFDPEGMLVEGFNFPCTMAMNYNYPYYPEHMEALGFSKDIDWIEIRLKIPEKLPERISRLSKIVETRSSVHKMKMTRKEISKSEFCHELFCLINNCYKNLYDYTILPNSMAEKYAGFYLKVVPADYISCLRNEGGELVAFGITMPSIVSVLQKTKGKLFPLGWLRLLWSLFVKHGEGVEMLLVGVRPDYQNTGINSILFSDLLSKYINKGVKWTETNVILETNLKNQGQFRDYEHLIERRRRAYAKTISKGR